MAEELYYKPLGPYKEYAPGGAIGQLPEAPQKDQTFVDPRTGVYYGAYTEEEIMDDQAKMLGMSVYNGLDPMDVAKNRTVIENVILPEEQRGTTDAIELYKNELSMGYLNMQAGRLGHQALTAEDDTAFLVEGLAKRQEAQKLGELSITDNRGFTSEVTRAMANQAGLMADMLPRTGPKVAIPLAIESALNVFTPYKGFTATKFAGGAVVAEYFNKQMRGDIYLTLRSDPNIDRDIAQEKANLYGTVSGVSESLGLRAILKGAGIGADIADRIVSTAQEGGTEWIQSVLEDVALWDAKKTQAERNGEEFTDDLFASIDFAKAQQGARAGILTAGGFAVPGASVKYSAAAVNAVQEADKKHIIRKRATELIRSYNEKQAELVAAEDKPTIPVVDPVNGQPVEAAPMDPVEIERADTVDGVAGTTVTDGEIDDFMLLDDPAEIDAAAEALVSSVNNVEGIFTADAFFNSLRSILSKQEAAYVEAIINARADSAGVDANTYIGDRQIAIKEAGYKEGVNAEVTFTEEGRAIIKAFTGANVSSVLHEVGHIFRRDLRGNDLAVVEKWAGVEPGGIWDVAAEEKFARAWERYLAEGKAPTQELIPAFNAFTKWITNIYKAIRGSDIDIDFDDGVRQVFDNLLVRQDQAKQQLESVKQQAMTLQQVKQQRDELYAAQNADRISTSYPTSPKRTVDPTAETVEIGIERSKEVPASFAKNAKILNGDTWKDTKGNTFVTYPGFKSKNRNPDKVTEDYINFGVDNLLWLYDQIPENIRQRSKNWYDGARHITDMWSERYGLPPANIAGVMASLSPQKDWYQNVSLAERVIDVMQTVEGTDTTIGEADKKFAIDQYRDQKGKIRKENRILINEVIGTPFRDLPSALHKATFVRLYDALNNERGYRIVTPEGGIIGEPVGNVAWGSNEEISKAVKAYGAQSSAEINTFMGDEAHKIRNFYNNIIAPNNGVDVTIDTHAKAALLLRPLSAKAFEVGHTFGGRGSGSTISGAFGLYGVDAEAYRRAAEARGILPREMQSITWEAVRGLFEDTYKRTENAKAKKNNTGFTEADAIWKRYEIGEITKEQARQEVLAHAKGINNPTWYGLDSGVSEDYRGTSYEGRLSGRGVSERTTGPMDDGAGGKPTGGPARLQQSRSGASEAEFRSWFRDSKIVDGAGNPLVMYHGTRSDKPFTEFKMAKTRDNSLGKGFYFTDIKEHAEAYAPSGQAIPVYLSIQNPFIMDWRTDAGRDASVADGKKAGLEVLPGNWIRGTKEDITTKLQAAGFDGVVVLQPATDNFSEHRETVAFTPNQIKSTENRRPTNDPDILKQSRSGASEAELQAKYQRELLERTAARDTAIAAAEGKLNPSKTLAEQIKAHRREMRRLFAAGETEGAKNERNKIKVLLTRQRNRANVQKRHTAVRKQLIKLLEDNLPKKISRKLQSGMDYDTQKVITELYNALMDENQDQQGIPFLPVKGGLNTVKGVNQMYYKYIEGAFIDRPLTPVEVLRNEIITAAFMRNKFGLEALQELYGQLGQLVRMGRKASPAMINLFKSRELVKTATPQIVGDANVDEAAKGMDINEAHRQRQKQKTWRQKLATMKLGKDGLLAWGDLLELISAYSGEKPGDSVLLQQLDFFDSGQKKKTDIRTSMDRMIEGYREAYGIKTAVGMNRRQNLDLVRNINIGWNREVNRAQLRQIWMYMQDPSLNERLVYNGIKAEQRQAIEREMTPEDRQFAQHLMNMFQDDSNYAATNEVYRRNFGVDLERFDNYVPLKAEPITTTQQALEADADTMSQFSQDKFLRRTPTSAGSLKGRAEDLWRSQLIFDGDLPLFQGWLEETAHFRAYADVVRLASAVVQDRDFRRAVIYEHGSDVYNTIVKNLKANAADDRANVEGINAVDRIRTAYVTSTIGMSTTVTMKQYISLLNFWQDMPFTEYIAGMASLPANMRLVQDIWNSDYLLNRKGNMDRDLKQAMRSKEYKRFMLNPSIKNFLTFNVTLGDSGAIALGGAVYVRYLMKQVNPRTGQKYTKAQAIHEMGRKADRTQQSGATEQLSEWQRGGSAMKILTTYSTGPVQATRQVLAANRNLAAGKIGPAQYAKEMFIYQVAVPVMYSAAAGLVAGDDADEQLKNAMLAAILGPWGSTYFAGRALTAAARKAAGMSYFENSGPFTDTTMDIAGYANKIAEEGWDSLTLDQYARAVQSTLVLFGYGVPLTKVTRTLENVAEGDIAGAAFAANPNR